MIVRRAGSGSVPVSRGLAIVEICWDGATKAHMGARAGSGAKGVGAIHGLDGIAVLVQPNLEVQDVSRSGRAEALEVFPLHHAHPVRCRADGLDAHFRVSGVAL